MCVYIYKEIVSSNLILPDHVLHCSLHTPTFTLELSLFWWIYSQPHVDILLYNIDYL